MTPKFHALQVSEIRKETIDTVSIAFEVPSSLKDDYSYLAGQYLTLKIILNGEEIRRSYSLCSAPYEGEWRVAVKQVEHGVFSAYSKTVLKVGDLLDVMTPTGNFTLNPDKNAQKNYALFGAGSGITPILSLLKTILHDEPKSYVTLFYGNKTFQSIIFREEIEALKNQYMDRLSVIHIFSRENPGNKIQKGRMDKEKCQKLYKAFLQNEKIDAAYICGPEPMILGVKEGLIESGLDPKTIHYELFTVPGFNKTKIKTRDPEANISSTISIIIDGDIIHLPLDSKGESVLDASLKAGADLPFACKGGVCSSCKAKIVEGTVRMDVNYALTQEEVDAGYILTCQSHPTSEKLIVSFDE